MSAPARTRPSPWSPRRVLAAARRAVPRTPAMVMFIGYLAGQIVVASLRVAWIVVQPGRQRMERLVEPAIVAVHLRAETTFEILALATAITLTPGTISVELSRNRKVLYVHTLEITDRESFNRSITNGLERRILRISRGRSWRP